MMMMMMMMMRPEGRALGRTRYTLEDNIRMNPKDISRKFVDWIHPIQNRANGGLFLTR
jgi:hypothetical protein